MAEQMKNLSEEERKQHVEIKRDLTEIEKSRMKVSMYSPCGCGSGKKFKFCCYQKKAFIEGRTSL